MPLLSMFKKVSNTDRIAEKLEKLCKKALALERKLNGNLLTKPTTEDLKELKGLTKQILEGQIAMEEAHNLDKRANPSRQDSMKYKMADGYIKMFLGKGEERQKFAADVKDLIAKTSAEVIAEKELERRVKNLSNNKKPTNH